MSRNQDHDKYLQLMDNIHQRYHDALGGYEFDFQTEIKPFLDANKHLALDVLDFDTDSRFHAATREKVSDELMELLMACHTPRFRERHFYEKYKFINMWLKHVYKEGLI